MPEVRRRRVADDEDKPVTRRRDRARAEEVDDEDDEIDATESRPAVKRRRPAPEPEVAEDDDEADDEEERPAPKAKRTRSADKPPPGIHVGLEGAESVAKSGAGSFSRLTLSREPELIKVLQNGPFVSYKQHWVRSGGNQGDRPYTCPETDDCPLCAVGDRSPSKVFIFNVLHLSTDDGEPKNKVLQIGITAYNSFKSTATPRGKDKPDFERDYWAVSRSGKGKQSQTNFNPVKERDLTEDWGEIFEGFKADELEDIVAESMDHLFDYTIIPVHSNKVLRDVARTLTEDEVEDDEDED